MTEPIKLSNASATSIERAWRIAAAEELGLVVDIDPSLKIETVMSGFYSVRQSLCAADPSLPLLDFYITLPRDRHALVIVRELKAQLE